ncbi:MAG: helix-turn-helix domain-containing protein [Filomicrobium sp.]
MAEVSIGVAAKLTGIKVPTIRYYEQIGLLSGLKRTDSNRRLYGAADLDRLRFIKHARELGFELDAIRTLLDLQVDPEKPCSAIDAIAREHLADVDQRIASLQGLKRELRRMIESCSRGRIADCRIIEVLQDHNQCRDQRHLGARKERGIR